jgi:hypothetical protein
MPIVLKWTAIHLGTVVRNLLTEIFLFVSGNQGWVPGYE